MKEVTSTCTALHPAVPVLPELGADFWVLESAIDVVLAFTIGIESADFAFGFSFVFPLLRGISCFLLSIFRSFFFLV